LIHTRRNDIAQRYELMKLERWNGENGSYECVVEPVENTSYEWEAFFAFYSAVEKIDNDEQFYAIMKKLRVLIYRL
jgi:hypothetical protein